jgi:hypothetical protein
MELRETGRLVRGLARRNGFAIACALAGALWVSTASLAEAARLADLRVGAHDDFTRVVLELDQPAGYRLVAPRAGGAPQLLLFVEAQAAPREILGKSPLVQSVTAEPTAQGVTVHIDLASSDVEVTEMILREPPRIVLDLRAKGSAAPAAAAKLAPAPKPERQAAAAAEPAMPVVALPASIAAGAERGTASPSGAAPIELSAGDVAEPAKSAAEGSPADDRPTVEAEDPSMQRGAAPQEQELAEAPGDGVQAAELATEPIVAERPAGRPAPAAAPPPAPMRAAPPRARPSLWGGLWSPMGLMIFGALVIAVGLVVARRRRAAAEDDPLFPVMSAEHAGMEEEESAPVSVAEAPRPFARVAIEDASFERLPEASDSPSLPFVPSASDAEEATGSESESIFEDPDPSGGAASPTEESEPVPASVLEQRMRGLEERLEQLVHSRERLERQVAAQTEELRVQRAAIARTQRVVRSMSKPEDLVTEPVPRST